MFQGSLAAFICVSAVFWPAWYSPREEKRELVACRTFLVCQRSVVTRIAVLLLDAIH